MTLASAFVTGTSYVTNGSVNVNGLTPGNTWDYSLDQGATWIAGNSGAAATGTTGSFVLTDNTYTPGNIAVRQNNTAGTPSASGVLGVYGSISAGAVVGDLTAGATGGTDDNSVIAGLSGGGYVVAWRGTVPEGGYSYQLAQYDASNNVVGSRTVIRNITFSGDPLKPEVLALSDGGYVLAWSGNYSGGTNGYEINITRYDANHNAVGSAISLHGNTAAAGGAGAGGGAMS